MSKENEEWIEVVVGTSVVLAEGLASELVEAVEAAKGGIQIRKGELVFWVHPPKLEETLAQVRVCLQNLEAAGWQVDPERVAAGALAPEEEWRDAWKKHFHVTRLTRQIVVVPSWESFTPEATDIVVNLDPGQAFGTGAHASTQLVLEELQLLVDSGSFPAPATLFDLGTGSGILAIAAAKLWPELEITATDIDPLSISATNENAEINGVSARIDVSTQALSSIEPRFPLILANIQAHILRDLKEELLPRLASGGRLLVSGILSSQIHSLCEDYGAHPDLELISIRQSKLNPDWSSGHFLRR